MSRTVGFIGLGVMGQAMARNLSEKYPGLLVFDVDKKKMDSLPEDKVEKAKSISDLARRATLVFLSLPTSAIVRELILGAEGLAASMDKGSVIVDTSTTEVGAVTVIAEELKSFGIAFIDAPISGGEKAAVEGTLSFMIGADDRVFNSVKEYFHAMGTSVVHMGPITTGQIAKAVNQMIVGAAFAVIAESFTLGVKSGLNPQTLYDAIKNGWAGSKVLDVATKDMLSGDYKPGGTVNIHWKDLGYALSLSKDTDVPVPVTALVHEIFKASRAKGDGKKSQPAVVQLWESLIGKKIN